MRAQLAGIVEEPDLLELQRECGGLDVPCMNLGIAAASPSCRDAGAVLRSALTGGLEPDRGEVGPVLTGDDACRLLLLGGEAGLHGAQLVDCVALCGHVELG